jgi:hypothetical protein
MDLIIFTNIVKFTKERRKNHTFIIFYYGLYVCIKYKFNSNFLD